MEIFNAVVSQIESYDKLVKLGLYVVDFMVDYDLVKGKKYYSLCGRIKRSSFIRQDDDEYLVFEETDSKVIILSTNRFNVLYEDKALTPIIRRFAIEYREIGTLLNTSAIDDIISKIDAPDISYPLEAMAFFEDRNIAKIYAKVRGDSKRFVEERAKYLKSIKEEE